MLPTIYRLGITICLYKVHNKILFARLFNPYFDAIAPECRINLLEVNSPAMGWQNSFFENKIRQPLQLEVLALNGVWEDDVTPTQQLSDILFFLEHQHDNNSTSSLIDSVRELQKHALGYLREIHVNASHHLHDANTFDYSEHKAEIAFYRMVNIQLSFEAIKLLEQRSIEATNQEKNDSHRRFKRLYSRTSELFSAHHILSLRYTKIKVKAHTIFALFSHHDHGA